MNRPLLVAVLVASLAVRANAAAPAGAHELLFLGEHGPLRLQLRINLRGKGLAAIEDDYHRRLFAFYDHQRKGFLDAGQARRALRGDPLRLLFTPGGTEGEPTLPGDRVTPVQLARLSRSRQRLLRLETITVSDPYALPLTQALFEALDANRDGKLARAEVKAAPRVLADLDRDEDECLVPLELAPTLLTARREEPKKRGGIDLSSAFVLIQPGESPALPCKQLFTRYDRSADGRLSRDEIGLAATDFARLDSNGDGFLDGSEVCAWLAGAADLQVVVALESDDPASNGVALAPPKRRGASSNAVRHGGTGRLVLRVGKQELHLAAGPAVAFESVSSATITAQFHKADREGRGVVGAADLTGASFRPLRKLLPLADRDGDGRLSREELKGYLELRRLAETSSVALTLDPQRRGWFEILDADHDGRLSVAELRDAWRRLADVQSDKTGFLMPEPRTPAVALTFSQGARPARGIAFLATRNVARQGPLWFRKMDRNGDGQVSRREFLGPRAEFERLDRDHDGLISPTEAAAVPKK